MTKRICTDDALGLLEGCVSAFQLKADLGLFFD